MPCKHLIGRHKELLTLMQTYDRIKRTGTSESVSVYGETGTGKTSLVLALRETVCSSKGFFCMGKYFQDSDLGQDPYSAIISSFSQLCDLVLQHCDEERTAEIKKALEPHAIFLKRAISCVTPFLNDGRHFNNQDETNNALVFAKFKSACKAFLRIMSSKEHPVVLFFDDVQWMDAGSSELIHTFLKAEDFKYVMLILAYRDKGTDAVMNICTDQNILLSNLNFEYMSDMVSEQLGSHSNFNYGALGSFVAEKTKGNPFHVEEVLSTMQREGLLTKKYDSWTFDKELLENGSQVSYSLSHLLLLKVTRLDMEVQQLLKVASLLGFRFTTEVLLAIISPEIFASCGKINVSVENILALLEKAKKEQILVSVCDGYQFSHDTLQNAFQILMRDQEKETLHFMIGEKFLNNTSKNATYQAAVHFNRALATIDDRVKLASINLEASKYCEHRSAFRSAVSFLRKGLEALEGKDKWLITFDLAFEMTESLARMEFIVGNWDGSKTAIDDILCRARSIEGKMRLIDLQVQLELISGGSNLSSAKWVLKELDIFTRKRITPLYLYRKLRQVRRLIDNQSDTDILSKPYNTCFKISYGIKLLTRYCQQCILSNDFLWGLYFSLVAAEVSLKNGNTEVCSLALNQIAVLDVLLGHRDRAYRVGELSLKLLKKFPRKEFGLNVVMNCIFFLQYQKRRIREFLPLFPEAYNDSFEFGNIMAISFGFPAYYYAQITQGENLHLVETSMRERYSQLSDFGREHLLTSQPVMQLVCNLRQQNPESYRGLITLKGAIMNEENQVTSNVSFEKDLHISHLFCKMILAFIFGFYKDARKFGDEAQNAKHIMYEKSYQSLPFKFIRAMISYRLYESTGRRKHVRSARKCGKFLKRKKSVGNCNATPFISIIEIEEVYLKSKDVFKVCEAYNKALEIVTKEGNAFLEVVAHELTGRILSSLGYACAGQTYLVRAKETCKDKWGAISKYQMLVDQMKDFN